MGPKFILLISPVSTCGSKICDLQVRALAKSILYSGLHFEFAHPRVLYEPIRVSTRLVAPFEGKRETICEDFFSDMVIVFI